MQVPSLGIQNHIQNHNTPLTHTYKPSHAQGKYHLFFYCHFMTLKYQHTKKYDMSCTYLSASLYHVHHDKSFVGIRPTCELFTPSPGTPVPSWEHCPSHS